MVVYLVVLAAALAVCTVFVGLEMGGYGPFVIANAPVWAWAAWVCVEWNVFFILWAILWTVRNFFIRHHYRLMKMTYAFFGIYAPFVLLLFAVLNFPILQLLVINNVDPVVEFWITRIIWVVLVLSVFWLLWEATVRFFIVRIEKDKLWYVIDSYILCNRGVC